MKESEILKLKLVYEKLVEEGMSASDAKKKATEMYIEEHRNQLIKKDTNTIKSQKVIPNIINTVSVIKDTNTNIDTDTDNEERKTFFKFAPREKLTYSENDELYSSDFIQQLLEDSVYADYPLFSQTFTLNNAIHFNDEHLDILIFKLKYLDSYILHYLKKRHLDFIANNVELTDKYLDTFEIDSAYYIINNTQRDLIKNNELLFGKFIKIYSYVSHLNPILYLFSEKKYLFLEAHFMKKVNLSIAILEDSKISDFNKLEKLLKNYVEYKDKLEIFKEKLKDKVSIYKEKLTFIESFRKKYYEPYKDKYLLNKIKNEIKKLSQEGKIKDPLAHI